jgi:hypothetical protein
MTAAFDLTTTYIHLSPGARATPLPDFAWTAAYLEEYGRRFAADGVDHPAGEEVVVVLSGRVDLVQEIEGKVHRQAVGEGQAIINPTGVWHTADVIEPGMALFITPGMGTEHRPR